MTAPVLSVPVSTAQGSIVDDVVDEPLLVFVPALNEIFHAGPMPALVTATLETPTFHSKLAERLSVELLVTPKITAPKSASPPLYIGLLLMLLAGIGNGESMMPETAPA